MSLHFSLACVCVCAKADSNEHSCIYICYYTCLNIFLTLKKKNWTEASRTEKSLSCWLILNILNSWGWDRSWLSTGPLPGAGDSEISHYLLPPVVQISRKPEQKWSWNSNSGAFSKGCRQPRRQWAAVTNSYPLWDVTHYFVGILYIFFTEILMLTYVAKFCFLKFLKILSCHL